MTEELAKKFYSVNLVAFIYMIIGRLPEVYKDIEGLIYFVYEDSKEISLLINVYKKTHVQVDLHNYLAAFKDVRALMRTLQ